MMSTQDRILLHRALGVLYRLSLERTGWRTWVFGRWLYNEPLRNDAANLVREAGYVEARPYHTRLVGDVETGATP